MDLPPEETMCRRGWRDTKAGWANWRFVLFQTVVAPGVGALAGWRFDGVGIGAVVAILVAVLVFSWYGLDQLHRRRLSSGMNIMRCRKRWSPRVVWGRHINSSWFRKWRTWLRAAF